MVTEIFDIEGFQPSKEIINKAEEEVIKVVTVVEATSESRITIIEHSIILIPIGTNSAKIRASTTYWYVTGYHGTRCIF